MVYNTPQMEPVAEHKTKKKTHNGIAAILWVILGSLDAAMSPANNEVGGIMICVGIYYAVKWFRQPSRAAAIGKEASSNKVQ